MKVSLIILTKNEQDSIVDILTEIPKNLISEIIVIDGNSSDNTRNIAYTYLRKGKDHLITQRKSGFGNGVKQGLKAAHGDIIILMCGDGSDDPIYIHDLICHIKGGFDYVRASRYAPGGRSEDDTLVTKIGNKLFTLLTNVTHHLKVSDSLYIYSAITRTANNKIKLSSQGFEISLELLIKAHHYGLKFSSIPVVERERFGGKKKIHSFLDGLKMLPVIFRDYS